MSNVKIIADFCNSAFRPALKDILNNFRFQKLYFCWRVIGNALMLYSPLHYDSWKNIILNIRKQVSKEVNSS